MKVAVLGAGTDGLIAAHACQQAGVSPQVYSRKVKTKVGGAQYLDRAIPGLNRPDKPETIIHHLVRGDEFAYRRKVYSAHPSLTEISERADVYNGMREPAWSLRRAYNELWGRWESQVLDNEIDVRFVAKLLDGHDLVFSTVPLMSICSHRSGAYHNFHLRQSLIAPVMLEKLVSDTVVWDGTRTSAWFRTSLVFGEVATEWPAGAPVPTLDKLMKVTMPIASDCNCWPSVVRLGRYGAWSRKEDTSEVFTRVISTLEGAKA